MSERRTAPRKNFSLYLRVFNDDTKEALGHMVQVSPIGLQLETSAKLPLEKDYYLRLELMPELADRPFMVFIARTKWCKMDDIQPNLFKCGFSIVEIMADDKAVFVKIVQKYGT